MITLQSSKQLPGWYSAGGDPRKANSAVILVIAVVLMAYLSPTRFSKFYFNRKRCCFLDLSQLWHTLSVPRFQPDIEIPRKLQLTKPQAYLRHSKLSLRNQCSTHRDMSRPRSLHFAATPSHYSKISAADRQEQEALLAVTENFERGIPSSWEKREPKRSRRLGYCRRRDEHNARKCPEKILHLHPSRLAANSSSRASRIKSICSDGLGPRLAPNTSPFIFYSSAHPSKRLPASIRTCRLSGSRLRALLVPQATATQSPY